MVGLGQGTLTRTIFRETCTRTQGSWRRWLAVKLFGPMGDLAVVVVQSLGPKGFPLALLKATRIDAEMPSLAAA